MYHKTITFRENLGGNFLKRKWTVEELNEFFTITSEEFLLLENKSSENCLGFIIMLKFFRYESRFPKSYKEVPWEIVKHISAQLNFNADLFRKYKWSGRSTKYHRAQIRKYLGFREFTSNDKILLSKWLYNKVFENNLNSVAITEDVLLKLKSEYVEPPAEQSLKRIINSVIHARENDFYSDTFKHLSEKSFQKMDELINNSATSSCTELNVTLSFSELKSESGKVGLKRVLKEIEKIKTLEEVELPPDLFISISPQIIKKYKARVLSEDISELRRHPDKVKYTLIAIFLWSRKREILDDLAELLIQIIHNIGSKAEKKVEREVYKDFKNSINKSNVLKKIAEAALENPDGVIKDIIFPIADEEILKSLVKEFKNTSLHYNQKIYTTIESSYKTHYRRMVPKILETIEWSSGNELYHPIIEAIEAVKHYSGIKSRYFPEGSTIPIDGVIKPSLLKIIYEKDEQGIERINRINYEIILLQALREKLRCKEIWIKGADRYRNPEEDLPLNFEEKREEYFKMLNLPQDAEKFIDTLKTNLYKSLNDLDSEILKNDKVKISKSRIFISPGESQPEPSNIAALKSEIQKTWSMTSLLDVLKETDLILSFTKNFKTTAAYERLDSETIQKRLILALYALGTNAGLKRVSCSNTEESLKDLFYIKKKYINKENLKAAISEVVNAILSCRIHEIWGEGTTTCASDGKKFGAWDQNLIAEWHIRYRGRGVMIYWHVEKKSACIYSQLKRCSSSEVSAMIEGLLRHCTDAQIEKNFTDTHGQSVVGFAFCYLLGFNLMPRIKGMHRQKLYRPDTGIKEMFPNLQPVLTKPIKWDLIFNQYSQMVKYAVALRLGTAETENILRRFTRNNPQHPTYAAFLELGKAVKTIFLCEYLRSEALRIEIHEGLNVVENWNSANSFIFYGKGGEISTNRIEEQELSVLSLQLIQNCLVYINTLMIQQILLRKEWHGRMTPEDFRALTPLIYSHINPYGTFELNMKKRIPINFEPLEY